jgi:hypothetical protein
MTKPDKPTDTSSREWVKHMRPRGKKQFNKKVRQKAKTDLRKRG